MEKLFLVTKTYIKYDLILSIKKSYFPVFYHFLFNRTPKQQQKLYLDKKQSYLPFKAPN